MKNVQQINTMLPMGLNEDSSVCTTSFKPGALLITLSGLSDLSNLNTCERRTESDWRYATESIDTIIM